MGGLGSCGLLESEIFRESDGYFVFQICNGSSASLCKDTTYLACMSGDGDKLPGRYLAKNGYSYCITSVGKPVEVIGAE